MIWNHRIIKDGNDYAICEVFYTDGIPHSWSEPITIGGESPEEIKEQLEQIIEDIELPILEVVDNKLIEI